MARIQAWLDSVAPREGGVDAFANCYNLKNIKIADSVSYIGRSAFCGCRNLSEIGISDAVTYIGENAFWHCPNAISIN